MELPGHLPGNCKVPGSRHPVTVVSLGKKLTPIAPATHAAVKPGNIVYRMSGHS